MNLDLIEERLALAGFNLFSVVNLPSEVARNPALANGSLLLIGNAGNSLWHKLPAEYLQRDNPIDEYSLDCIDSAMKQHAGDCQWEFMFPAASGNAVPNLQSLGVAAGWHHDSPLGIGINQHYGLWFGYRSVVWVGSVLPCVKPLPSSGSPCLDCTEMPCLQACPAGALSATESPDLVACSEWRVTELSSCASNCLARTSCPVAPQWRYSQSLLAYYYEYSLPSLIQWVQEGAV